MDFEQCLRGSRRILMEGALGERLKGAFGLTPDPDIALAATIDAPAGREALAALWGEYIAIAKAHGLPLLTATPTRRANRERVARAGRDASVLRDNATFLRAIQAASGIEMYAGGLMGCKGDAYTGQGALSAAQARAFHRWQAEALAGAGLDYLYAGIMPTLPEALGMAQAMGDTGLPYIISFTIQKDGRLIDGTAVDAAIGAIDEGTARPPVCYMTNCVHPDIALQALEQPFNRTERVRARFWGIQANASPLPYDQLDGAANPRNAPPGQLAEAMIRLRDAAGLRILGGCCGTDGTYMEAIARRM
ncbi:MAG: homocysteine S-methyltransferase family protein [Christensenellales bacterium]|jgi:S-methylmethionine-dependent homocysteine/selenocysteine methylase